MKYFFCGQNPIKILRGNCSTKNGAHFLKWLLPLGIDLIILKYLILKYQMSTDFDAFHNDEILKENICPAFNAFIQEM